MINKTLYLSFQKENFLIYLKNGRFIFLLFILASATIHNIIIYKAAGYFDDNNISINAYWMVSIFTYINIIGLSLYLVPFYFKNNNFKGFWIRFLFLYILCSLGDFFWIKWLQQNGILSLTENGRIAELSNAFFNELNAVLSTTGVLYFLELFEEIELSKATKAHIGFLKATEKKLNRSQADLPYLQHSLKAILNQAKQENNTNTLASTSERMLLFSDILRYKLYGENDTLVALQEELNIVQNLIQFYNSVALNKDQSCELEIEGKAFDWQIEKQSLIKIVYPFLSDFDKESFTNFLIYIEIIQDHLEITIQAECNNAVYLNAVIDNCLQAANQTTALFSMHNNSHQNQCNLNLCLKLQEK